MDNVILAERVRLVSKIILAVIAITCIFIVFDWWAAALLFAVDYASFYWARYENKRLAKQVTQAFEEFMDAMHAHAKQCMSHAEQSATESEGGHHD